MTEKSLFWYTDGFTGDTGDGAAPYTQEEFRLFNHAWLAKNRDDAGVFPGVLNELEVTGSSSPLSMNTGRASVYGFPYWADSAVSLSVSTPSVGNTGGRVVLQADWTAQTVRAVVITNTDGVATLPVLTQTAGSVWEIPIASFVITTGGSISALSDERDWILTGKVYRQGGDPDDFDVQGSTDYLYETTRVIRQFGVIRRSSLLATTQGSVNPTFPVPFVEKPLVLVTVAGSTDSKSLRAFVNSVSLTAADIAIYNESGSTVNNIDIHWEAVGLGPGVEF